MTNYESFAGQYRIKLTAAIERSPKEYRYPVSEVPDVVERMMVALSKGSAHIGPAVKATAKALGINPSNKAIREYLNS
jgi:hypothetical protein